MSTTRGYLLEVQEEKDQPVAESFFQDRTAAEVAYYRSFYNLSQDPSTVLDFTLRLLDLEGNQLISTDPQKRLFIATRAESAKGKSLLDSYLANRRAQLNPNIDQI